MDKDRSYHTCDDQVNSSYSPVVCWHCRLDSDSEIRWFDSSPGSKAQCELTGIQYKVVPNFKNSTIPRLLCWQGPRDFES
jgi:hypothetical protein